MKRQSGRGGRVLWKLEKAIAIIRGAVFGELTYLFCFLSSPVGAPPLSKPSQGLGALVYNPQRSASQGSFQYRKERRRDLKGQTEQINYASDQCSYALWGMSKF